MEKIKNDSGQAVTEYILLLGIVIGLYSVFLNRLSQTGAIDNMKKHFTTELKYTYQFGNATSRGQSDGGPTNIVLYHDDADFRVFINPPINE